MVTVEAKSSGNPELGSGTTICNCNSEDTKHDIAIIVVGMVSYLDNFTVTYWQTKSMHDIIVECAG